MKDHLSFIVLILAIPVITVLTGLIARKYKFTLKSIVLHYISNLLELIFELLYIPIFAIITLFSVLRILIAVFVIGLGIAALIGTFQNLTGISIAGHLTWHDTGIYFGIVLIGLLMEITVISYLVRKSEDKGMNIVYYMQDLNLDILHKIRTFIVGNEKK